jgi:AmmeMemoRadiSam system protein B
MVDYPKLRHGLEAVAIEHQGQRRVLLRDCLGYAPDSLLIPVKLAALLLQMNGENSLRELQAYYVRVTGELLFMENLQDFVKKLNDNLFLENEHFQQLVNQEIQDFQEDPIRRMRHAGTSYPVDSSLLRSQLNHLFSSIGGSERKKGEHGGNLVGLIAPHIDVKAGGPCFAHAYQAVLAGDSPATWVVLGTGHEPIKNYFALTLKDFETPLSVVRCDQEFSRRLLQRAPRDLLAGEYSHRKEHTIEFQAVFLAHTRPTSHIVPLLCSFSLEDWETDRAYIDEVAGLLRDTALQADNSIGFLASVDLAHIGPRYGDAFQPHMGTIRENLDADRELLGILSRCDALEFMHRIGRGRNRRRICGMAPLYVLARILEGSAEGELLEHTYAIVDNQESFVTFAAMAFYREAGKKTAASEQDQDAEPAAGCGGSSGSGTGGKATT